MGRAKLRRADSEVETQRIPGSGSGLTPELLRRGLELLLLPPPLQAAPASLARCRPQGSEQVLGPVLKSRGQGSLAWCVSVSVTHLRLFLCHFSWQLCVLTQHELKI